MDGLSRSSRERRGHARRVRAALVTVVAIVGLVAAPGTASAAGEVAPVLDCLRRNTDGTYTAILGYTNSSTASVTIPVGSRNNVSPARHNGSQPTVFAPGTKRGAFSVTITSSEYMGGPYWSIDGNIAFFGWSFATAVTTCPPSTELPEEGNGTGSAIALVAAGVVGAVAIHRVRRRTPAAAGAQPREGCADA